MLLAAELRTEVSQNWLGLLGAKKAWDGEGVLVLARQRLR